MGVVNKFDRTILSSATRCSFNTLTALITVLPVPKKKKKKSNIIICKIQFMVFQTFLTHYWIH